MFEKWKNIKEYNDENIYDYLKTCNIVNQYLNEIGKIPLLTEKEEKELRKKDITIETKIRHLELEEEVALKQIDSMKNELVNIYRYKQSNGKDRFDLASDKAGKLNDDKAYCCALLGWQISNMRRENIAQRKRRRSTCSLRSQCESHQPQR